MLLLPAILLASACAAQNHTYTPDQLNALAAKDTKRLTDAQASALDAFWLKNSSGIFQQCRSQYPEDKKDILLIIKNDLSGKVLDLWMLSGGQVGTCLVQYIRSETMPKPPFEPFYSPLYASP